MALTEELTANDLLKSEKELSKCYGFAGLEAALPAVKNFFVQKEEQVQAHQYKLFELMYQENWYTITPAEQTKISQAVKTWSSKV